MTCRLSQPRPARPLTASPSSRPLTLSLSRIYVPQPKKSREAKNIGHDQNAADPKWHGACKKKSRLHQRPNERTDQEMKPRICFTKGGSRNENAVCTTLETKSIKRSSDCPAQPSSTFSMGFAELAWVFLGFGWV